MTEIRLCQLCKEVDISDSHFLTQFCDDCGSNDKAFKQKCRDRRSVSVEIIEQTKIMVEANRNILEAIKSLKNPSRFICRLHLEADKTMAILKRMSQTSLYKTVSKKR